MLRRTDQSLCTRASPVRCHQCFPDRQPETFFVREMWFKKHLSVVDQFTVPSRFMAQHYISWGLDPAKISHVTNGQPDYGQARASAGDRAVRNRFGYFGQLVDNKGVWVLLQAVNQLRAEGFKDFIVEINGDNLQYASETRRYEFEAFLKKENELPLEERIVTWNGSYSVDQLTPRMSRVDWCVVPSVWWEIFGLVISEAWMFKRPVIASNVGGPAERVTHEKDGLLFDVADATSLAQAIKRACTEKGLWDRLVSGITPPASEKVMVDGYMEIYRRIAERRASRVPEAEPVA
jgi:glycosyltransferase involved in cell wall biosynthesis